MRRARTARGNPLARDAPRERRRVRTPDRSGAREDTPPCRAHVPQRLSSERRERRRPGSTKNATDPQGNDKGSERYEYRGQEDHPPGVLKPLHVGYRSRQVHPLFSVLIPHATERGGRTLFPQHSNGHAIARVCDLRYCLYRTAPVLPQHRNIWKNVDSQHEPKLPAGKIPSGGDFHPEGHDVLRPGRGAHDSSRHAITGSRSPGNT